MTWEACELVSGPLQPVYARWAPGREPIGIWTFDPQDALFRHLTADKINCTPPGPE